MPIPTYDDLLNPALEAVHSLGRSSSISEMSDHVARTLDLTDEDVNEIHRGNRTKLEYRLAWARTYLKNYGILDNSQRGIWSLTSKGRTTRFVDKEVVKRAISVMFSRDSSPSLVTTEDEPVETRERIDSYDWQEKLAGQATKHCTRCFREALPACLARVGLHPG
jgi:restriction system protein